MVVREGIALIIGRQADMEVVGSAATGEEAIELCRAPAGHHADGPAVAGTMSGLDAIRAIRRATPRRAIIVLTMYQGRRRHLQRAGGRGRDLSAEGHAVRRARPRGSGGPRRRPPDVPDVRRGWTSGGRPLTPSEIQVVQLVAEGCGTRRSRHARHQRRDGPGAREEHLREARSERPGGCHPRRLMHRGIIHI